MLLQRFGAILSNISGADLEAFAVPLANKMEANRPLSLLRASSILDYQQQKAPGGLILWVLMAKFFFFSTELQLKRSHGMKMSLYEVF